MKSLMRLYGFLRPYRIPASISLSLLVAMVAADLLIPRLTQRIIDQGIAAGNLHVVVTTALIMVAFVPLIIVLVFFFTHRARPLFLGVQQRLDRLNVVLQENLAGIRVVKAFVRAAHEKARFDDANQDLMAGTIGVGRLMAVFHPFMLLILNLAIVAAVWFGGATAITGGMSVDTVVAAINYLSFALFPILMLTGMIGPVSAADASASRILEVLDAQPQARQHPGANRTRITRGQIVFTERCVSRGSPSPMCPAPPC